MLHVTHIGIDLAKRSFRFTASMSAVTRCCAAGSREPAAPLRRAAPALSHRAGACGSAHYWAREMRALGHDVRLMAPQFVTPYRKNDKNDGNDAEAICEAVGRPHMRFVR